MQRLRPEINARSRTYYKKNIESKQVGCLCTTADLEGCWQNQSHVLLKKLAIKILAEDQKEVEAPHGNRRQLPWLFTFTRSLAFFVVPFNIDCENISLLFFFFFCFIFFFNAFIAHVFTIVIKLRSHINSVGLAVVVVTKSFGERWRRIRALNRRKSTGKNCCSMFIITRMRPATPARRRSCFITHTAVVYCRLLITFAFFFVSLIWFNIVDHVFLDIFRGWVDCCKLSDVLWRPHCRLSPAPEGLINIIVFCLF